MAELSFFHKAVNKHFILKHKLRNLSEVHRLFELKRLKTVAEVYHGYALVAIDNMLEHKRYTDEYVNQLFKED